MTLLHDESVPAVLDQEAVVMFVTLNSAPQTQTNNRTIKSA